MLGDRYRLDEIIGRGGMAEVWRAWDTRLGRDVAVKRLRVDLATDPTFQARFQREAQSAAGLNHPNIVSVYDTGAQVDPATGVDIPYIVMELVQGTTLRELLKDGRQILPERALEFTVGVLDAIAYAHRHGIVHRDIKPANVMLTTTGRIKVMDFGIARAVADTSATMTQTAAVIGTAQYLSPEQARGETVDARSDIYSVGCLLYELLTSRPPFVGDSPVSVAYQHVREQPVPPSRVDPELPPNIDTVVLTALAKNPDARYQNADAMRVDITRLLGGQAPLGVAAVPDSNDATQVLSDRLPPGARPRRGFSEVLPGIAAAGTVGAVGVGAAAVAGAPRAAAVPDVETTASSTALLTDPDDPDNDTSLLPSGAMGGAEDEDDDRGWLSPLWIALGVLVLAVLVVGGLLFWRAMQPQPEPPTVAVPQVVGLVDAQARSMIANAQLSVTVNTDSGPANTLGQVLRQDPQDGTQVAPGSTVTIWVNNGPGTCTIPMDVVAANESDARTSLKAAGFTNIPAAQTAPLSSDEPVTMGPGQVLTVNPGMGSSASCDSAVTLTLATGKSQVPDLWGMTADQATSLAGEQGFQVSTAPMDYDANNCNSQPNTVCRQNPAAQSYEFRGYTIYVSIAGAPPPPPPVYTPPPTTVTLAPPPVTTTTAAQPPTTEPPQ